LRGRWQLLDFSVFSRIMAVMGGAENVNIAIDTQGRIGNIDIMKTPTFHTEALQQCLRHRQMAMIGELCDALGSACVRTVYRKLKALGYLSSYSHRGQYYTLPTLAAFDAEGLWGCRAVWFSKFGNLLATAQAFVERSSAGYTAAELTHTLHVQCQHALTALARVGRVTRERIQPAYVYFSGDHAGRSRQRLERQSHRASLSLLVENPDLAVEEAKAAIVLFLSTLDERQRRLYAGLESLKTGHGGDEYIAHLFGLDRHTVARGREELLAQAAPHAGVRRGGGGRPATKKNA
jgi:hypothetical protein